MGCAFIMEGENRSFFNCSYTSLNNLRKFVAKKIGIDLEEMEFFGGKKSWSSLELDSIHLFFAFRDCEGDLNHHFCGRLANGLSSFLETCEKDELFRESSFLEIHLKDFINGLRRASDLGRTVSIH